MRSPCVCVGRHAHTYRRSTYIIYPILKTFQLSYRCFRGSSKTSQNSTLKVTNGCSNKPLEAHLYCTRGGGIGKPGKSSDFPKFRKTIEGKIFLNFLLKFLKLLILFAQWPETQNCTAPKLFKFLNQCFARLRLWKSVSSKAAVAPSSRFRESGTLFQNRSRAKH